MAPARENQLIDLALRKNPRFEESESPSEPRYFLLVSSPMLRANATEPRIPVYWGPDPHPDIIRKEVFRCAVLGEQIEKANLPSLMQAVRQALGAASSGASFPSHLLAGSLEEPLPVYASGGRFGTSVGSTAFHASNIVELWHRVGEHLSNSRKLQDPGTLRLLTVGGDLDVLPQVALFVHAPSFRVPVLPEGGSSKTVYTFLQRERIAEGRTDGGVLENVLRLWQRVAEALIHTGKLRDPGEVCIAQLRSSVWEAQQSLAPTAQALTYTPVASGAKAGKTSLEVYQREKNFLAALPEGGEERAVFISSEVCDLAERVGKELVRQGTLDAHQRVAVETLRRGR